jgi:hypothetical protein
MNFAALHHGNVKPGRARQSAPFQPVFTGEQP